MSSKTKTRLLPAILPAAVLLLGAADARGEDAALYPVRDCGNLATQMEMNACAGANYTAADAALNKAYQQLMAQQTDASSKEQLKDVERAWIVYRDRQCAFEVGPQQTGGSIWPMEMSNCLEEKSAARLRELDKLLTCTAGDSVCNPH